MPIAQLEGLSPEALRDRKSEKWNSYPADVLPAWVAEMDFPLAPPIRRYLDQAIESSDIGYPIHPSTTGLREVFSERMSTHFDWNIEPREIEILSEVVQGIYLGLHSFASQGEGIVVQTPIYPPFLHSVEDSGMRLADNPLQQSSTGWEIDFDALGQLSDPSLRVFLLCNPHNPSGRAYTRSELEGLADFALRNDLVVISDEIHADLLFDGKKHIPFASLSPEIAAKTITLSSASKAFNIPGLRCAIAHFGAPALRRRFNTSLPRHIRGGMGILGLYASIVAWREGEPWLDEVRAHLESNRDYLLKELTARIPEIVYHKPDATYLAWLDCSQLGLDDAPAEFFIRHGRVALSEGSNFGADFKDFARLNFATSREILQEVIDRMVLALESRS